MWGSQSGCVECGIAIRVCGMWDRNQGVWNNGIAIKMERLRDRNQNGKTAGSQPEREYCGIAIIVRYLGSLP